MLPGAYTVFGNESLVPSHGAKHFQWVMGEGGTEVPLLRLPLRVQCSTQICRSMRWRGASSGALAYLRQAVWSPHSSFLTRTSVLAVARMSTICTPQIQELHTACGTVTHDAGVPVRSEHKGVGVDDESIVKNNAMHMRLPTTRSGTSHASRCAHLQPSIVLQELPLLRLACLSNT